MSFDITNKVALVTGGAQGLGYECAKELLRNNAKGVVIADINMDKAKDTAEELNGVFGQGKVVAIKTDTTDMKQYERAFKLAVERFGHVDILVNNAGIAANLEWQVTFKVNINGFLNGMILGLETYLKNFKSSKEAVIINTSSVTACIALPHIPIYSTTKYAVLGMTKTWGHPAHFERTGVRVIAICPGMTDTNLVNRSNLRFLSDEYIKMGKDYNWQYVLQRPEHVGREMVNLIKEKENGSFWVVEDNLPPYQYILPDKDMFNPAVKRE